MSKTSLILGTAGHIDHGKTALVRALTGVDTDRLAEEKQRGITIELGFARYTTEGQSFGIVDVPGHEGFVRTMVAGATGMDIVLLVIAADEGVMPQTREHLAIISLLDVAGMVVALTKTDLVDAEWLELVTDDVRDFLATSPYKDAEIVPTSVETGTGITRLSQALLHCGTTARYRSRNDLFRLPVDRVFAVSGAGTVVTGTLWSGQIARGDGVTVLPSGDKARVRSLEVHGESVDVAYAGQRTAVALTGASVRRGQIARGHILTSHPAWVSSPMLTVQLTVLPETGWAVESGQRVRVHLGTVEVMARLALFDEPATDPTTSTTPLLAQLRLEAPLVARCGDRFVIRSYSPVTTIAGGQVLEPSPPKRRRLSQEERAALAKLAMGRNARLKGAVTLAGYSGLSVEATAVQAGIRGGDATPQEATATRDDAPWQHERTLFSAEVAADGEARILATVAKYHAQAPLQAGSPLDILRTALPARSHPKLADGLITKLQTDGRLVVQGKLARLPDFVASLSQKEEKLAERLRLLLEDAGLQGPTGEELQAKAGDNPQTGAVLKFLASKGEIRLLGDAYWVPQRSLDRAAERVQKTFAGQNALGPADFRHILPVTRKHLIPLLTYLDGIGVTVREESGRRVP